MVEQLRRERVAGTPEGFTLDPIGLPAELRRRLVLGIFAAMGSDAPRGEAVTRLLATLAARRARDAGGGEMRGRPALALHPGAAAPLSACHGPSPAQERAPPPGSFCPQH